MRQISLLRRLGAAVPLKKSPSCPLSQGCRVLVLRERKGFFVRRGRLFNWMIPVPNLAISGMSIAAFTCHTSIQTRVEFFGRRQPGCTQLHHLQAALTRMTLQTSCRLVIRDFGASSESNTGWLGRLSKRWTVHQQSEPAASLVASGLGVCLVARHEIQKSKPGERPSCCHWQLQQGTYRSHFMYL